jgi:hypothetical protein
MKSTKTTSKKKKPPTDGNTVQHRRPSDARRSTGHAARFVLSRQHRRNASGKKGHVVQEQIEVHTPLFQTYSLFFFRFFFFPSLRGAEKKKEVTLSTLLPCGSSHSATTTAAKKWAQLNEQRKPSQTSTQKKALFYSLRRGRGPLHRPHSGGDGVLRSNGGLASYIFSCSRARPPALRS